MIRVTMVMAAGLLAVTAVLLAGTVLLTGCEHAGMPECSMHAGGGEHGAPSAGSQQKAAVPQAVPAQPGPSASGQAVNVRCPIMGGRVDPARLTAALTRDFDGRTVGFCCGGCPDQWDRLTAAEKTSRLAKVTAQ